MSLFIFRSMVIWVVVCCQFKLYVLSSFLHLLGVLVSSRISYSESQFKYILSLITLWQASLKLTFGFLPNLNSILLEMTFPSNWTLLVKAILKRMLLEQPDLVRCRKLLCCGFKRYAFIVLLSEAQSGCSILCSHLEGN